MSKTTLVVEATNVTKTYMLGKVPVEALRGVNLKVESGDFLAILGPSGSGKSTMLNLVGALDKPTSGTLLIDGVDISKLNDNQLAELRLKIGFVFQFFNLIPRLTAKDNVELSMSIANMGKAERKKHAIELLETVGLKDRVNHKPAELSGGQQQRVAIARALANNPKFLLLDEPTNDLDIPTLETLEESLLDFPGAVVLITHDRCMLDRICNTLLALGNPEQNELFSDYHQWEASLKKLAPPVKAKEEKPTRAPSKAKLSYAEKKEYEQMEEKILKLEEEVRQLNLKLESPEIAQNPQELQIVCSQIGLLETRIEQHYLRWEELEKKLSNP
jgi:putative ABC transport system ATP-binding protein